MKGKRIWSGLLALVFCLGLLPATALAAAEGSEKHTDHTEWTALTEDVLKEKEYQLEDGQYYFSGTEYEYGELVIETSSVLTVTGNVTLCLNNVSYTYTGNNESAVVVEENASLTICMSSTTAAHSESPAAKSTLMWNMARRSIMRGRVRSAAGIYMVTLATRSVDIKQPTVFITQMRPASPSLVLPLLRGRRLEKWMIPPARRSMF